MEAFTAENPNLHAMRKDWLNRHNDESRWFVGRLVGHSVATNRNHRVDWVVRHGNCVICPIDLLSVRANSARVRAKFRCEPTAAAPLLSSSSVEPESQHVQTGCVRRFPGVRKSSLPWANFTSGRWTIAGVTVFVTRVVFNRAMRNVHVQRTALMPSVYPYFPQGYSASRGSLRLPFLIRKEILIESLDTKDATR